MNDVLAFKDETFAIRGAAFAVYKTLGPGFLEEVYQNAFEAELAYRGIPFEAKRELHVMYRGRDCGLYIPDLVCFGRIIVELKAVEELNGRHEAQVINYLRATNHPVGLLVNFGAFPKVDIRRLVNLN